MKRIILPLKSADIKGLKAGDEVLITGRLYTARDAAHKRMAEAIGAGKRLPADIKGAVIYYTGPAGAPRGAVIGSCGPTTSGRMDGFTPALLASGLKGMIGKGRRDEAVRKAIKRHSAVYFLAPAGAGALLSEKVRSAKRVAYRDLGPEAVYELFVEDFPAIVGIDSSGNDIYKRLNTEY